MLAGFRTSSGKVVEAGMKGFCEYAGSIALQGIGLQGITCVWAHQLFLAWPQTPAPMPAITPSQTGCCSYAEPCFVPPSCVAAYLCTACARAGYQYANIFSLLKVGRPACARWP